MKTQASVALPVQTAVKLIKTNAYSSIIVAVWKNSSKLRRYLLPRHLFALAFSPGNFYRQYLVYALLSERLVLKIILK